MAAPLAVSPFLAGDPIRLGPEISSLAEFVAALDDPSLASPGLLEVAPGVALIHSLTGDGERVALRWVRLPHAPRLIPGAAPVETAVVLTGPIAESEHALRLISRLLLYFQDAGLVDATRAAGSREALVEALAPAEQVAGECPLGTGDLLALHGRVPYRAAVVFRMGSPACPAARHAPPGGGAEVAASNRRTTEDRLMTTLGLRRKVIEDPVETVMTRQVVLILEDIPMSEVRAIAAQYDYNGFPVVTQEGRLVGVITKGDLLRAASAAVTDPDVGSQPVSSWMAHGVLALRPKESLRTAVENMVYSGFRSLPVIDGGSRVVGIVSRNDLMTAIGGEVLV